MGAHPSLFDFLLARIADDEAIAGDELAQWHSGRCEVNTYDAGPCDCGVPSRALAECEAKRRIVEGMRPFGPIDDINAAEVLGLLALPYADHPDYREEWRP